MLARGQSVRPRFTRAWTIPACAWRVAAPARGGSTRARPTAAAATYARNTAPSATGRGCSDRRSTGVGLTTTTPAAPHPWVARAATSARRSRPPSRTALRPLCSTDRFLRSCSSSFRRRFVGFGVYPSPEYAWRDVFIRAAGRALRRAGSASVRMRSGRGRRRRRSTPRARQHRRRQLREELQRLRKEFESIRDAYGARLAALEARLAQPTRPRRRSAVPRTRAAPLRRPAPDGRQPGSRRRRSGPDRRRRAPVGQQGRCRSTATPARCRRSSTPTSRSSATSSARRARTPIDPRPALQLDEAERALQAVVDPYARADFFLPRRPRPRGRRRLPDVHDAARRPAGEGREAEGAVRQGQHACTRTRCRGSIEPLVVHEPLRRRRRAQRLGHLGLEADSQPGDVPRSDRRDLPGQRPASSRATSAAISATSAGCAAIATSPRATNLDVGGSFAYGHNDAGPDFTTRRSASTRRCATVRCAAPFIAGSWADRAFLEPRGQEAGDVSTRSACMGAPTTSSPGAGSPAPATTGPSAPTTLRSSTRVRRWS